MPEMTSCHGRDDIMSCQGGHRVMPGMTSCHARDDIMSCHGRHLVTPGVTCCQIAHDSVLRSKDHSVWQLWLVLADLAASHVC